MIWPHVTGETIETGEDPILSKVTFGRMALLFVRQACSGRTMLVTAEISTEGHVQRVRGVLTFRSYQFQELVHATEIAERAGQ